MKNTGFRHTRLCSAVAVMLALPISSLSMNTALADSANSASENNGSETVTTSCLRGFPAPFAKSEITGLRATFFQDNEAAVPNCYEQGAVQVWDFGDGSQYRVKAETLTVRQINHSYENDGDYTVRTWFESGEGGVRSETAKLRVTVKDIDPVVHIDPDYSILYQQGPNGLQAGDTIHIDGSASVSKKGRKIASYLWSTGETAAEIDFPVDSEFLERGASVTLTVTDESGASQSRTIRLYPQGEPMCGVPPVYTIWSHFSAENSGKEVTFADTTSNDLGGLCPLGIDSGVAITSIDNIYTSFSGTRVFWDFGDGTTSENQTRTVHAYEKNGEYTVLYAVEAPEGMDIIHTAAKKVTVGDSRLRAVISGTHGDGTPVYEFGQYLHTVSNEPIVLSAESSEGLNDSVTYRWSTGETTPYITVTPSYHEDQKYSVVITDAEGNSSTAEVSLHIDVPVCSQSPAEQPYNLLTPNFAHERSETDSMEVVFTDKSVKTDTHGCAWIEAPVTEGTWTWDFGDGTKGTGKTVSHRYSNPGRYEVTLTVVSGELTDVTAREITVPDECTSCTAPNPDNTVDPKLLSLSAVAGQSLVLDADKYLDHYEGATYLWSTGARGSSIVVQPQEDSFYTVKVYDSGAKLLDEMDITVNIISSDAGVGENAPVIVIATSADNTGRTVLAGTSVTFDASHTFVGSSPDDAKPDLSFRWSNGKTDPVITETITGDTTLRLEVTNNRAKVAAAAEVSVSAKQAQDSTVHLPPVARISYSGSSDAVTPGTNVVFTGMVSSPESERTYTYAWTIDGISAESSERILNFAFATLGAHRVTFTVTDDLGQTDTAGIIINVAAEGASVAIDGSSIATAGENTVFTANTVLSDASDTVWTVDGNQVPDSRNSTLSYVFNTAGSHEVAVTVTDSEGVRHTAKHTITVNPGESTPFSISFAAGNESVTAEVSDAAAVPFITSDASQEKNPLQMQIQGHMAVKFDNISGPASLHVIRIDNDSTSENTVACQIDSNYQVTCARDTRTGSTAVDVHNASTVSLEFAEAGEYRIHISARSQSSAETQGYIPLNVVESLSDGSDGDVPSDTPPEVISPADQNDGADDSSASSENSGGKKGGALDFLSLLFLTGASILMRGRRKK
ncbi:PKD domain-containing protein [Succinimonas amylolytica]|uniref:PKD domain-containing protein n=1 Tax=Succinimonas amylolytica TaxID=83769 RepID=UPI0023A84E25